MTTTKTNKQRKLAAILFADIVGYTAMMQEDEPQTKLLRDQHRALLQAEVERHNGQVIQFYGDGSLNVFESAVEAVNCAMRIQLQSLQEPVVPLKIGIHLGDVVLDDEGAFGDGVNVASRIESLAIKGSVMISGKVFDEIKNHPTYKALSMGKFELKNVSDVVEVYAIVNDGLVVPRPQDLKGKVKESFKSIAVMPFVNLSSDADNEYFSDGITEELINAFTRVEGLRVTSRTSSFTFKGKNQDVRTIAQLLNVQSVLEGSVRKAGNKVRITAQLINGVDGFHIWSENFDRNLEDIFAVQDEISQTIALKLRTKLSLKEQSTPLVAYPTDNLIAYNAYLLGLYYYNKWTPANALLAVKHFEKAIAEAPGYVPTYAAMAKCYTLLSSTGFMDPVQAAKKARIFATKSIELDPNSTDAYLAMSFMEYFNDWDWDKGEYYIHKAIEINPNAPEAHLLFALHYSIKGDLKASIQSAEKAHAIDPISITSIRTLADIYYFDGQFDKAHVLYDEILNQDPQFLAAKEFKGWTYLMQGAYDTALEIFISLGDESSHAVQPFTQIAYAYALQGNTDKALEYLEKLQNSADAVSYDFAIIYTGLKKYDQAFEYLYKCFEERLGSIVFLKVSPIWKPLQKDPRFKNLTKKLNLT